MIKEIPDISVLEETQSELEAIDKDEDEDGVFVPYELNEYAIAVITDRVNKLIKEHNKEND